MTYVPVKKLYTIINSFKLLKFIFIKNIIFHINTACLNLNIYCNECLTTVCNICKGNRSPSGTNCNCPSNT